MPHITITLPERKVYHTMSEYTRQNFDADTTTPIVDRAVTLGIISSIFENPESKTHSQGVSIPGLQVYANAVRGEDGIIACFHVRYDKDDQTYVADDEVKLPLNPTLVETQNIAYEAALALTVKLRSQLTIDNEPMTVALYSIRPRPVVPAPLPMVEVPVPDIEIPTNGEDAPVEG